MKKGNRQIRKFSIVMEHKLHQFNKKNRIKMYLV